jgi:hypothetical protein
MSELCVSELPGDEVSQEEYDRLQELKEHPIAASFTDHVLMVFLLARKLNVKRAVTLLENHKVKRAYVSFSLLKSVFYSWRRARSVNIKRLTWFY